MAIVFEAAVHNLEAAERWKMAGNKGRRGARSTVAALTILIKIKVIIMIIELIIIITIILIKIIFITLILITKCFVPLIFDDPISSRLPFASDGLKWSRGKIRGFFLNRQQEK